MLQDIVKHSREKLSDYFPKLLPCDVCRVDILSQELRAHFFAECTHRTQIYHNNLG
jgi:hypothetical protein